MDNGQRVRPGSITEKCVGYLKGLKPGAEISGCMLARAIGHTGSHLSTCLQSARRNGVLKARRQGKLVFWSLGPTPTDLVRARAPALRPPAQPAKKRLRVSSVFDLGSA